MKKLEEMRANTTTKYADQIFVALLALLVIFPNSTAIEDFRLIVPQKNYQGKLHGDVTLEWRGNSTRGEMDLTSNLEITCVQSGRHGYVYYRENGVENLRLQNKDFNGRVKVNQEALRLGKIEMTIVNLTIKDKGIYQCAVRIAGRERYDDLILNIAQKEGSSNSNVTLLLFLNGTKPDDSPRHGRVHWCLWVVLFLLLTVAILMGLLVGPVKWKEKIFGPFFKSQGEKTLNRPNSDLRTASNY